MPSLIWVGRLTLAVCVIVGATGISTGSKPAFAAGEVLNVSSDVVEHGATITLTVTNIVASSFCDYLPYAGEGYYAEAYILNLSNDIYFFPPQSERFDPRKDDSVTLEVVLPGSFPVGMAAITVDCMYPDGRQTGNTAKPRTVEVVARGASPQTQSASPEATAEEPLAEQPAQVESGEPAPPTLSEPIIATPRPLPRAAVVVEQTIGGEPRNMLVLDGNQLEPNQEIIVRLEGVSSTYAREIHVFTVTQPSFRTPLILPSDLSDGEYRLTVAAKALDSGDEVRGGLEVLVDDARYFVAGDTEVQGAEQEPEGFWWLLLGGGATAFLALLLALTPLRRIVLQSN